MWPDTRLQDLLGIEHPIIQAPMAGASTPSMVAAAASAGCLGSLGCAFMTPESYRETYAATRAATNGRINMNFFCHAEPRRDGEKEEAARARLAPFFAELGLGEVPPADPINIPYADAIHEAVMATAPGVVSFHFGLPEARHIEDLKGIGTVILCSATTPEEARDLEARGVDAVIAQGWEAGGHHGFYLTPEGRRLGTMALVPQVVDAVSIPVIAAGGIADGRGVAAALALGAAGVQLGTFFLTGAESEIAPVHKQALAEADGAATAITRAFSGRPARGIVNRYMQAMADMEDDLPDFPLMNGLAGPLRTASAKAGSPDFVSLWSGQAVGLSRAGPIGEMVDALVEETRAAMARLGG